MKYFFLLGSTPELSLAELQSVLQPQQLVSVSSQIVSAELKDDHQATQLFQVLGGSVKLLKSEGEFTELSEETLYEYIVAYLAESSRPTFAIAEFNRDNLPKIDVTQLKQDLKERNISSRFIEGSRSGLSASILLHHSNVIELNLIQQGNAITFAKTLAVQDIDNWTVRDREKPYFDRKKGMLPPKVARMMVNIGIANQLHQQAPASATPSPDLDQVIRPSSPVRLYDPFCGSGTVLIEGLVRGCEVVGSDLDQAAVMGTHRNLTWFQQYLDHPQEFTVFASDVSAVSLTQLKRPVNLIVTEPFLGRPTPQPAQLANIFKGLEKLYLGSFKQWIKILEARSTVVIIFPYVKLGAQVFSLENMIDKLAQFGYTPVFEPILYHRPQAVVQRQIWTLKYQKPGS